MNKTLIFLLSLSLSGCLVGPNYQPPEPEVCDQWQSKTAVSNLCLCSEEPPPTEWWQLFCDPLLDKYIVLAATHNNDLLAAESTIYQAKAMRQITAAALYPHVNVDLNIIRNYFSKNGPLFSSNSGGVATGAPFNVQTPKHTDTIYNALIDLYWEIDLFGKTRRSVEAAQAYFGGAIESRNDLLISIFAEVAMAYIQLRSAQSRGKLIEEELSLLEKNLLLVTKQFQEGYRNQLDVEQVEAALAQAASALPESVTQIFQSIYSLSVLTGNLPECLLEELLPFQSLPQLPEGVALGMRSDLIRRRPDVRAAERQLAAAVANIGVAVASFFPSLPLLGYGGLQSLHLSNLFQAKSLAWSVLGDLHIPIFEGGKLVGRLRANEAQAAEAAFQYQQVALSALQEAESGLVAYSQDVQTTSDLQASAESYGRVNYLTEERFAKGLVSLTDLLNSERQWNVMEQNVLTSHTAALLDLIKLYKALGGGWEPFQK